MKRLLISIIVLTLLLWLSVLMEKWFPNKTAWTLFGSVLCSVLATYIYDVLGTKSITKDLEKNVYRDMKDSIIDMISGLEEKVSLLDNTLRNYKQFSNTVPKGFALLFNGLNEKIKDMKQQLILIREHFRKGGAR